MLADIQSNEATECSTEQHKLASYFGKQICNIDQEYKKYYFSIQININKKQIIKNISREPYISFWEIFSVKYYPSECYLQYQNYLKQFICPHWGNSYVNPTLGKILCSYKNTYKDHENIKYLKFYILKIKLDARTMLNGYAE